MDTIEDSDYWKLRALGNEAQAAQALYAAASAEFAKKYDIAEGDTIDMQARKIVRTPK